MTQSSSQQIRPGVLALQGSSEPHLDRLRQLGFDPVAVRQRHHLEGLTHLIMPGGESTTIHHLLELFGLSGPIQQMYRSGELSIFGTCAGAILIGQDDDGERPPRMLLLDAVVDRNAYGTQLDSFTCELDLGEAAPEGDRSPFHAVFIRAPIFKSIGSNARALAWHAGHPVLVEGPRLLAASFHPELTEDTRIHERFLSGARVATSDARVPAPATT